MTNTPRTIALIAADIMRVAQELDALSQELRARKRSEAARMANATRGPEGRSEAARKANANRHH
jgi:hypothetical protein